jgi:hypothetical protein
MKRTKESNRFREIVIEELQPALEAHSYRFRSEFTALHPPEIPDDFYLPFTKKIDDLGYIHLVFSHSFVPKDSMQEFDVLLLRYEDYEPVEAWAMPIPGRPRTNIVGYLPGRDADPLPLILSRHMARQNWQFYSDEDLRSKMQLVRKQLENIVLSWIENPTSTQFIHVEKSPFLKSFDNYVTGIWSAETAYTAIQNLVEIESRIEAGDDNDTYLVNEVARILYQLQIPNPINRPHNVLIEYLLACLRDERKFDIAEYRELLRALRPPRA